MLDSRVADDGGSIRRRRQCPACERRFTTIEQMQLVVVKRSGVVEPFNRDKVITGVRKACKGRPVTEDQLARLGQLVEDSLRASGQPEMPADEVGVAILGPLRELDQVAYLRFASVYRQFRSVDDFEAEIALLRVEQEPTGIEPLIPDRLGRQQGQQLHPAQADTGPQPADDPRAARPAVAPTDPGTGPRSRGRLARHRIQPTGSSTNHCQTTTADRRGASTDRPRTAHEDERQQ